MLTITCSSSAGSFFAVLDSGKLIWTSGWSFLNVVETTKKISRMIRISTSEMMIMRGARRFRTAKFMASDAPRVYATGVGIGTGAAGVVFDGRNSREERP